jgi:RNA polymerase sigma-70 factor (ECF subfamily)
MGLLKFMNEYEAITLLKKGNIIGLKTLVQNYQVQAIRTAYFITQDKNLAKEVVQDAFLRVYERIEQFDVTRPFPPWFFRIVTNLAIKAAKKEARTLSLDNSTTDLEEPILELIPGTLPEPDDTMAMQQLQEEVWQALGKLTPKQRSVIVMRYYLDMSEAEMSDKLEIASGTVKWHLYAARERLRALLNG